MSFGFQATHYDLLEVKPDATPQEIREAYLRVKSAYRKDSAALYSLMSAEETEDLLRKVEEAYRVLSSPETRREYDRSHGTLQADEYKVVSIDRVPPMDRNDNEEDLLIAPATDFTSQKPAPPAPSPSPFEDVPSPFEQWTSKQRDLGPEPLRQAPPDMEHPLEQHPLQQHMEPQPSPPVPPAPAYVPAPPANSGPQFNSDMTREIEKQEEWKGEFLKTVRSHLRISIEEMASFTKISKTYIMAIEADDFAKLPAAVFVRGFVSQIAKALKLPHEKVAAAYMARCNEARARK